MGAISEEVFSTSASPGAFCLNCRFLGGALSVSPFSALTGAYQSSLGIKDTWWSQWDSNSQPTQCHWVALANWSYGPKKLFLNFCIYIISKIFLKVKFLIGDPRQCRPVFCNVRGCYPSHRRRWGQMQQIGELAQRFTVDTLPGLW